MDQREHKKTNNKKFIKSSALILSLVAITLCIVANSLAYLIDTTDEVENIFQPSSISSSVSETIEGTTKRDVKIQNTGNIDGYIRAMVVVLWKDESGNTYGAKQPVEGTDYTIEYAGGNWTKESDGYWYYANVVNQGAYTENLIQTCSPLGTPPTGYQLSVEIIAEAIQTNAITDAWGYTPSTH